APISSAWPAGCPPGRQSPTCCAAAEAALIGIVTVRQFETGAHEPPRLTLRAIRRVFEAAGVESSMKMVAAQAFSKGAPKKPLAPPGIKREDTGAPPRGPPSENTISPRPDGSEAKV